MKLNRAFITANNGGEDRLIEEPKWRGGDEENEVESETEP